MVPHEIEEDEIEVVVTQEALKLDDTKKVVEIVEVEAETEEKETKPVDSLFDL